MENHEEIAEKVTLPPDLQDEEKELMDLLTQAD